MVRLAGFLGSAMASRSEGSLTASTSGVTFLARLRRVGAFFAAAAGSAAAVSTTGLSVTTAAGAAAALVLPEVLVTAELARRDRVALALTGSEVSVAAFTAADLVVARLADVFAGAASVLTVVRFSFSIMGVTFAPN